MATPEELYEDYLYNNTQDIAYDVVSFAHSDLTQDYYLVGEKGGLDVTLDTGEEVSCMGVNFEVSRESSSDDLDVSFSIVVDDLDDTLKSEANNIPLTSEEDVVVTYYTYMKSDTSSPAYGPIKLYADGMTAKTNGQVTVTASAPSLVVNRCGELYTYDRFPMLKAYL